MATAETSIVNQIMLALSKHGIILWRNVRGVFLSPDGKHRISAGLMCKGSSDLIGYKMVTITPAMVNSQLAVFCALEIKTPTGRPSSEQVEFITRVKSRGGKAGIARSVEDALEIVR